MAWATVAPAIGKRSTGEQRLFKSTDTDLDGLYSGAPSAMQYLVGSKLALVVPVAVPDIPDMVV